MKIINDFPPNIDAIRKVLNPPAKAIFAYGDAIYNPRGGEIPAWLVIHEETHRQQQAEFGGPDEWWQRYLTDSKFRFQQELEAHRMEYRAYCELVQPQRNQKRLFLKLLARRLSGPLYGRLISFENAKKAIKS